MSWHQDEIYIPTRDRSLIGAWIAIDDATVENACLYVVSGSHRNGYLLHRSRKNRSQGYRRVLVNHYMNAWSLLPWSLREKEHVAMADRRKVIPVAGVDPYAWKGYEPTEQDVWLRTCKANTPERDEHDPL